MQQGEAEDTANQPSGSDQPSSSGTRRTRNRSECPLNKLSVRLLDTYNNINQRYYANKGREKKKKKRARDKSKAYDYQVVEGAYLGEGSGDAKRYKIEKEIGKGSFGKVVRAYDSKENEWVAIKIVKKKSAFLKQAETEIKILQALQAASPNDEFKIVRMKHYFKHQKHQCIVFELLYRNLYELLLDTQYKGVSLNLVRKFGKQILVTLYHLRERGVIHCDLKPENVLMRLKHRSHIKVIDFGSACFASEKAFTYIQSRFYRAPEVLLGIEYSFPIDMWSLGCMLVEMHTGKPLFPGRNEQDQMCKQVEVLGMPPNWMIETGKYGLKHFSKCLGKDGKIKWESTVPPKIKKFSKIMEEARRLNTGKRGHTDIDYCRFEELVSKMLDYDASTRITPEQALQHSFFRSFADSCTSTDVSYLNNNSERKIKTNSNPSPKDTISIEKPSSSTQQPMDLDSNAGVQPSKRAMMPSNIQMEVSNASFDTEAKTSANSYTAPHNHVASQTMHPPPPSTSSQDLTSNHNHQNNVQQAWPAMHIDASTTIQSSIGGIERETKTASPMYVCNTSGW